VNGLPVLTPPKSVERYKQTGMRTRLRGTQARGAGESHTQEANVAEVNYGEPSDGEPEYPVEPWNHPAVSDAGGSASERLSNAPDKQGTNGVGEGASRGKGWRRPFDPMSRRKPIDQGTSKTLHPRG
jgi:hypothetical protein